jgi:uncharacterized protein (DUF58 family)
LIRRALYRSFRFTHTIESWIGRRFTTAGRLAVACLGAAAVMGIDTNRTVAYQAFSFLGALLLVALASSLWFRGRFAVRRSVPRFGTAGEPLRYRVMVENLTDRRQTGLVLMDRLADPRPSFEEFMRSREPGEERRNWFDRTVGYPRWAWLVSRNRGATLTDQPLPALAPRTRADISPEIVPARRGHLRFTHVDVARPDPFGLYRACVTLPAPSSVLILPRRYPMPRVTLPGARRYQRGGVALATSVGDSEEFASLRDYRPGDPLRRIHWKSWARLGKPIVKEYQDEFFVRHALVLDTFAPGEGTPAFEEAVSVAASFACAIQTQESLLDLLFVGPEAHVVTAGRGLAHTERMLEILACVRACATQPFLTLHRLVLDRHAGLSGCICVLLGWDAERQALVTDLEARGIPTLALVVSDAAPPAHDEGVAADRLHFLQPGRIAEGLSRL